MKKLYRYGLLFVVIFFITVALLSDFSVQADEQPICSPTPTITPPPTPITAIVQPNFSVSQSAGSSGTAPVIYGSGSSTQAPASATCTIPFSPPTTPAFKRLSPTQIQLSWWTSTDHADSQDIEYGYSADNMPYGAILDTITSVYTINDLQPNRIIFAKICAFKNGCQSCSQIIDP